MSIDSLLTNQIKILAIDLGINASTPNVVCPFCNGGYEKEKSFSIIRYNNVIYYQCFRAKCGERGVIPTTVSSYSIESRPKKIRKYYGTTEALTEEDKKYLYDLWGLLSVELSSQRIAKDSESADLVMPLFTYDGYDAGIMLRRLDGRKPKTLTFWSEDVPNVHFPLQEFQTTGIMVVEDIPSAIKASRYMNSCALLGTNLSEDVIALLASKYYTLYLALDADATQKAFGYKRKYSLSFGNFVVVPLSKDIKNMQDKDLDLLMGGLLGKDNRISREV